MGSLKFSIILFGLRLLIWMQALRYQAFRDRLKEKNFTAQMKTKDNSVGRWFTFKDGRVSSGSGVKADADIVLTFKTSEIAARLLMPPVDQLEQINAMKEGQNCRLTASHATHATAHPATHSAHYEVPPDC